MIFRLLRRSLILLPSALCAYQATQGFADKQPLRLSMKEAVEIALAPEGNTTVQLAREGIQQAKSRSAQARASLLPSFESYIAGQNQTRNLAALGLEFSLPVAGFRFPTLVGPFSVFDVRAQATQSVLDVSSIRRFQSARAVVRASETETDLSQDQIAGRVAKAYLAALVARARVRAAQADVELAEAVLKLATGQKAAGTGTAIEVTRARVQLASSRQALLVAQQDQAEARLRLLRAMNLRLDADVELTEDLELVPWERVTFESALQISQQERADLKTQQHRLEAARLNYSAAKFERLPSVQAFGDYGSIGNAITNALPTRTYGISVRLPIFDGGRRDARRTESKSQFNQERIRTNDLKDQIAMEVRLAMDSLRSAEDQVKVAEEGLALAEAEVAQAERRYKAGVTTSVEVTDAQARVARARQNRIAALSAYNSARLDFGLATGTIRRML